MPTEQLFNIFNSLGLLAWLPLIFAPKWSGTRWLLTYKPVPTFLGLSYLVLLLWIILGSPEPVALDFSSLQGVKALFAKDEAVLIGWIHYLAFDLMVGIYESEDAQKRGIPHLFLVPCLLLTFIFGPVGWLLYWLLRSRYPIANAG